MKPLHRLYILLLAGFSGFPTFAQEVQAYEQSPSPMIYHSLVHHTKAKRILLFGGNSKHAWKPDRAEVWQYDPNDGLWAKIGRYEAISDSIVNAHSPAYDEESDRIIVFNSAGETWAFDFSANRWENMKPPIAPSPRCGQSMVYDRESDLMVLFGGFGCTSIDDPILNDTWTYDYNSNRWEKMKPEQSPPNRMYATMAYNSKETNMLLWGGRLIASLDDTSLWKYSLKTNTWTQIATIGGPDFAYAYPNMVYNQKRNELILFGGGILTEAFAGTLTDELWKFDIDTSKWHRLSSENVPPPVYLHSMVLLEDQGRAMLFGGEIEKMYSNILLPGTWKLDLNSYQWSKN
ncbi:MAG: kelch repeat-containing protein [Bacteroidota bacterium]